MRDDYIDADDITCAFCGKPSLQARSMIQGPNGIYICDECIAVCADAMMQDMFMQKQEYGTETPFLSQDAPSAYDGRDARSANEKKRGPKHGRRFDSEEAVDASEEGTIDVEEVRREALAALPTPHDLYNNLSEHVVGQEAAKRALSVAVYNHYKRIMLDPATDDDVEIDKSNIMLLGPTGSGKTLLAQTLARTLQVPFCIADATTLTEAGYVGEDVENILLKLITAADYDIEAAQIGIVYIDEIDKIARKAENLSITRDVSGEGVQQSLLKIVEGCEANVPPQGGRKHPEQELLHIDTTNILFILGGAFVGLSDIIAQRVGKSALGFASDLPESKKQSEAELLAQVLPEDLNKFGMIPEFIGRIPVITSLEELSEDDLVRILTEPKNALVKQYKKLFELENSTLVVSDDALRAIAHEAVERGTGARGLRSICERALMGVMYDLPEYDCATEVEIRATDVTGETFPEIRKIEQAQKQSA